MPKRKPLTRQDVLKAALAIVDADGLAALSMRRLAHDLGVEAMSLYYHVANKDDLLGGIAETVMTSMEIPEPLPTDWMDLMEAMMLAFRRALAQHPAALPVMVTKPIATGASTEYIEAPLRVLAGAGFSPAAAGALYQASVAYTFGHALISTTPRTTPADAPIRDASAAETYPNTVAAGARINDFDEAGYRHTLRLFMKAFAEDAGFSAYVERD